MSEILSEEEMRAALFGNMGGPVGEPIQQQATLLEAFKPSRVRRLSSRLRVILHVTKDFEGPEDVFTHDADTLSTLIAEAEAKAAARKKKYRYFNVISVTPVQVLVCGIPGWRR
ncbi:hypothetical protein [Pseudomonas simiae]|uniref:Uncharacterized protein n=1 Tax=Pseudomonas simiae TaxID=321846 RepID=A0A1N7UFJ9_9PSED|nr:hypothetical protein [Pseudomonas simiae]AIB37891.1 hypothetical protein PS417_20375 [Pseudomonas simiae]